MKNKLPLLTLLIIAVGLLLTACTGGVTASSWPGLSANPDMVFLSSGQFVYGVRLSDGSKAWQYPEKADAKRTFYANPVITADGQLLVSSFDHTLISLNPQNGNTNWSFPTKNRVIASPLVDGEVVYLPSSDNTLYAIDLHGNLIWKFATGNSLWAQPAVDQDNIYFTSMDHSLYAVRKDTGKQVWSTDLGAASAGTPALSDSGVLYIGTVANEMLALDATRGNILWRTATEGMVWSGPAVTTDSLYFGDVSGKFYAVNPETGSVTWTAQPDGAIVSTPIVTETTIVFGTESGSLVALDYQGAQIWKREIGGKLYTTPLKTGNRYLAAVTQGDKLIAYLDENGNPVWGFVPEK